ncbi:MAG: 50S ribosomal protein L32 [Rickettsiaceae bacterium]|nr:50S ribosomal protein L32 [Rickettsiaceae bacterium]
MAVPKKKTSKSKRNMRRSHHAIAKINVIVDKETGEYRLPHQMNPKDGLYNGRKVLFFKEEVEEDEQN